MRKALLGLGLFFLLCTIAGLFWRSTVTRSAVETASKRESEARRIAANIRTTDDVDALNDLVRLIALPVKPPLPKVAEKGRFAASFFDFRNAAEIDGAGEKGKQTFALWYAQIYVSVKMGASMELSPVPVRKDDLDKIVFLVRAKTLDKYAGVIGLLNLGLVVSALLTVLVSALGVKAPIGKRAAAIEQETGVASGGETSVK